MARRSLSKHMKPHGPLFAHRTSLQLPAMAAALAVHCCDCALLTDMRAVPCPFLHAAGNGVCSLRTCGSNEKVVVA